jgi:rRNA maturation endonuclease Nob1
MQGLKHWVRIDPWTTKCPYCGYETPYPEDICEDCGGIVLPCKTKNAEG